jgi:hypothetical protein
MDDPMGVAKQLAMDLEDRHNDQECFIRSIRTGEKFNKIKMNKKLIYDIEDYNNKKLMYPKRFDSKGNRLDHFTAMHGIGKILYQIYVVDFEKYKNTKALKEVEGKINLDMLKDFLAVEQRRQKCSTTLYLKFKMRWMQVAQEHLRTLLWY